MKISKLWKQNRIGADCILLIASSFGNRRIEIISLFFAKKFGGLEVLMEVLNGEEIGSKPLWCIRAWVGVNNRKPKNFRSILQLPWIWSIEFLLTLWKYRKVRIFWSETLDSIKNCKVLWVLIGENFMKSARPEQSRLQLYQKNIRDWLADFSAN